MSVNRTLPSSEMHTLFWKASAFSLDTDASDRNVKGQTYGAKITVHGASRVNIGQRTAGLTYEIELVCSRMTGHVFENVPIAIIWCRDGWYYQF